MTWKQLTERDRREWKLSVIDPHDRDIWRSGVRSAMRAASQLPGRGPTVADGPCTCMLIKKSDDDDDEVIFIETIIARAMKLGSCIHLDK